MRGLRWCVPVVVGVVLVAAGCSGPGEQPAADGPASGEVTTPAVTATAAPSSPSTSPSESGRPVGKRTPGQFDEATQAEAEAFVEDWWATLNAALHGSTPAQAVEDFYQPSCRVCRDIRDDLERAVRNGQRAEGGEQRVLETDYDTNNGRVALVRSVVQPQPGRLLAADGRVIEEYRGGPPADFVFNVVRTDEGWVIQDLLAFGPRD